MSTPIVSIIIPCYNHERYLKKRLDSIYSQSYQDREIIFLDDASTDSSRNVFEEHAIRSQCKVLCNDVNSGSAFTQWARGIGIAQGKYIWIAESDDYADPCLLSVLVEALDRNPSVGVAYCNSWLIDNSDFIIGSMNRYYIRFPDVQRWKSHFINDGQAECAHYLCVMNTIPNASAVVFRRTVYEEVGGAVSGYRLCGDWHLWMRMLLRSNIAFIPYHMNYFRRHRQTVRAQADHDGVWVQEAYEIIREMSRAVNIPATARALSHRTLAEAWIVGSMESPLVLARAQRIFPAAFDVDPHVRRHLLGLILRNLLKYGMRNPLHIWRALWALVICAPSPNKPSQRASGMADSKRCRKMRRA